MCIKQGPQLKQKVCVPDAASGHRSKHKIEQERDTVWNVCYTTICAIGIHLAARQSGSEHVSVGAIDVPGWRNPLVWLPLLLSEIVCVCVCVCVDQ